MEARGSDQDRRPASWTARIVVPLVLALVAAAIVLIVTGTLSSTEDGGEKDRPKNASSACQPEAESAVEDGYYVIEPEEDLSVVADRTCIPIERLEKLNENLDPQLLPIGACVDLRRDGCKVLAEG